MTRKPQEWKLRTGRLLLGERTLISAVLNVTPDSLADGGRYVEPERAYARALEFAEQGADIIEIGAESFRQGSTRISEAEELRRLIPVLKLLRGALSIPVCVETYKAAVAEKALSYGVEIIKDPSALIWEPDLAKVVVQHDAGLIIQHMRGKPEDWAKLPGLQNPAGTLITELKASVSRAVRQGLQPQRLVIDPGLGMGKRKEQNSEILRDLDRFADIPAPLQISPTGKHFATSPTMEMSLPMWTAATVAAILRGAFILRVHDVEGLRPAILVADELVRE